MHSSHNFVTCPIKFFMMSTDTSLAAGEFQQAVDAILPHSVNYSESLGLVESVDVAALLGQYPAGAVTVFLPNNGAYNNTYVPVIDAIFSYDLVNEVALYHVVGSFLDYNTLLSSHPSSLTTASGLQPHRYHPQFGSSLLPLQNQCIVFPNGLPMTLPSDLKQCNL
jgi:uncharacterized surface protein with fasciclin (FAS1) repeats